jgi:hypothetical protein
MAADEMLLDDSFEDRRIALAIPCAFRIDHGDRTAFADAQAIGLVRRMPPCSDRPSSFSRRFRYSHAAMPRSLSQHFGLVCSQQRKMCRRA